MPESGSSRDPKAVRAVMEQMRSWEASRVHRCMPQSQPQAAVQVSTPAELAKEVAHFVTLSNAVGSGGRELATRLADRLGWPIFDRQILTLMAGDDEVRAELYRSMDERDLGWFEETFRTFMHEEFRKNDYFHRLTETVLCLARQGPAVFIGRAADLILPRDKGLRIKVFASHAYRVRSFAAATGVDLQQAATQVERIDAERAHFIHRRFNRENHDITRFDLLIDLEQFTSDQALEIIFMALRFRGCLS